MKRMLCLVLSLMLLCGSAQAAGIGFSDPLTNAYLDGNSDVHFAISAQIEELNPYGEGTVDMFNAALEHISMAASITESGNSTALELCVAGDPVISLQETAADGGSQLTTALLPKRVLTSSGSAMDAFAGTEEKAFDLFAAISEAEACYEALTDAIKPYAEEKKANYKIKNVAASKWSRVARLTTEQSAELAPLIADVLSCGMDESYRARLENASYGKNFVVALYQTEKNGEDMAVYMKGDITLSDGVKCTLSYQWAWTVKAGSSRTDSYKLEIVKPKGAKDSRKANALIKRSLDDGKLLLDGECVLAIGLDDTTTTTTDTYDLSGKETNGVRTVTGSLSTAVKTTQGEKSTTITTAYKPDLKLASSEGSGVISGRVDVEQKKGKQVLASLDLIFDEEPAEVFMEAAETGTLFVVIEDSMPQSSLMQNLEPMEEEEAPSDYLVGKPPIGYTAHTAPREETQVNLDDISEEAMTELMDELSQNLAGKLLIALSKLPEESTAILRDNLSEEDYAAFEALVEAL